MWKIGITVVSLLMILSFALYGQSLVPESQSESEEDDALAEEAMTAEPDTSLGEEPVPEDQAIPEEEEAVEEAEEEQAAEAEETPEAKEPVRLEEVLKASRAGTSEEETTGAKEITREDLLEVLDQVHGKRGRRQFKAAYWAAGLEGDKKKIYDTYGHPSSRYREDRAGVVVERWTYIDQGKQFIFQGNKLTRTRRFEPGTTPGYP
jgi:hypothetical protein